jgi:peptidoglycan/LPS O-acetylase OafA/YrhL
VAALGAFLLMGSSSKHQAVEWPVLLYFGRISYGLYLVHLWIFSICGRYLTGYNIVARFIVAAAISVLLAYLSRTYFEEYFLRLKENPPLMRARLPGLASESLETRG